MKKLHFSITIDAPREHVWDVMLEKPTYEEWTKPFDADSTYEGDWEAGSTIKFIGPDDNGKPSGMFAEIAENRQPEFLSIRHLGEIKDGVEEKWDMPEAVYENYTLTAVDGGTKVDVDLDSADEYADMFTGMWPKALTKLKEIAERN